MSDFPETRQSLLVRVQDPGNQAAWQEFVEVYGPVVYRLARRRGLQDADALDVSQQVFVAVSRSVQHWKPDAELGRFRAWLGSIARNTIVNLLTRKRADVGVGGTTCNEWLEQRPEPWDDFQGELEIEYRRETFRRASRMIRSEFHPDTWAAFWMTTVEQREVPEAARLLRKSVGSVYAARSRIMRRLKEVVCDYIE